MARAVIHLDSEDTTQASSVRQLPSVRQETYERADPRLPGDGVRGNSTTTTRMLWRPARTHADVRLSSAVQALAVVVNPRVSAPLVGDTAPAT